MTAALEITLVRHGETVWSLSGQHTGTTDLALTARGEEESRALAPVLAQTAFAQVLVSPRLRAQQTCALAGCAEASAVEPDLAEWDYGDYEGLSSKDICQLRPDWNVWRDGCPHGEMPAQVAARADRLIARLCRAGWRCFRMASLVLRWRCGGLACRWRPGSISRCTRPL